MIAAAPSSLHSRVGKTGPCPKQQQDTQNYVSGQCRKCDCEPHYLSSLCLVKNGISSMFFFWTRDTKVIGHSKSISYERESILLPIL